MAKSDFINIDTGSDKCLFNYTIEEVQSSYRNIPIVGLFLEPCFDLIAPKHYYDDKMEFYKDAVNSEEFKGFKQAFKEVLIRSRESLNKLCKRYSSIEELINENVSDRAIANGETDMDDGAFEYAISGAFMAIVCKYITYKYIEYIELHPENIDEASILNDIGAVYIDDYLILCSADMLPESKVEQKSMITTIDNPYVEDCVELIAVSIPRISFDDLAEAKMFTGREDFTKYVSDMMEDIGSWEN